MSGLLDKLKTKEVSTSTTPEPVSLEELLLEETKLNEEENLPSASDKPETVEEPKSRKTRRKKLRSNRVVAKRASGTDARREQNRQASLYRERNRKALLKRQKQSNQKNKSGSRQSSTEYTGRVQNNKPVKKSASEKLATTIRPVVLGTVEFEPCYDRQGKTSSSGKLLKLKRSTRRIKLDRQLNPAQPDTLFPTPPLADLLGQYSNAKKQFLDSLAPTNITMYDEALSAFGLTLDENVSNTETLYTLLNEYALALKHGTARLDESSTRSLDSSTKLIEKKDNIIEGYYSAMTSVASTSFRNFALADTTDAEIAIKCLLSILAKEILFSYNLIKNETRAFNPKNVLQTRYKVDVLTNPKPMSSDYDAHGVVFSTQKSKPRRRMLNYPFESSEVLDDNHEARSSINFLKDLLDSDEETFTLRGGQVFDDPYQASLSSYSAANSQILDIVNSDDLEFGDSIFEGLLDSILSALLPGLTNARYNSSSSVQAQILRAAAVNIDILTLLLLYLAFRNEKINQTIATDASSDGPTKLVKKNRKIRNIIGLVGDGKVSKTFTVEPQEVDLSPGAGDPKVTSFKAPEETQTATLETTPANFEEGTLESFFDVSFEDVCDGLAIEFNDFLRSSSNKTSKFSSSGEVTATITQVKDALADTTTEESLFDYLLSYEQVMNSALPASDSDVTTIIAGPREETPYSGIPKRNLFMAFSAAVCKVVYLLLDGKASSKSSKAVSLTTTKSVKGASKTSALKKSISKFSKSGKSSTSDPSLTFSYGPDYLASLSDLTAYLNSEDNDISDISDTFPIIASISSALRSEELFLKTFTESITNYFSSVNDNYKSVEDVLALELGGHTLRSLIEAGLIPSKDVAKLLKSLTVSFNDQNMVYKGTKVRDNTIGKTGLRYLSRQLRGPDFENKKKVFIIGVPAGLLEDAITTPAQISEIRSEAEGIDRDKFRIVAQKIDQVRPELEYEDVEFEYSRSLFAGKVAPTGNSLKFVHVKDDLTTRVHTQNSAVNNFGMNVVTNHRNDFILKQYSDLQLDLDFNETAFPNDVEQLSKIMSDKIDVGAFAQIDKANSEFLSSSNLAFDPQKREPSNFSFYDSDANVVSLSVQEPDPYAFSMFEYINTYGAIFNPDVEISKLNKGLMFDKVICILVDDDDFKIKYETPDEDSRGVNAEMRSQLNAEKMVQVGSPTSQGLDLNTYRFKIVMGASGE